MMPGASTVAVKLADRSYDVLIGHGLIAKAGDVLAAQIPRRRTAIVSDETVAALHAGALIATLKNAGIAADLITVKPGEASKDFDTLAGVIDRLLALQLDRGDVIIALGDGKFQSRNVKTGAASGGRTEITDGLKEGETVVTSAQFMIDSESSLRESLQKLTAPDAPKQSMPGMEMNDGK